MSNTNDLKELYITNYPMFFEKYSNNILEYGNRVRKKRQSLNLSLRNAATATSFEAFITAGNAPPFFAA